MSPQTIARIKLASLSASAGALSFGLLWRDERFAVAGAILYFLLGVAELFQGYHEAKLLRAGTWKSEDYEGFAERFTKWIARAITLAGLVLACASLEGEMNGYGVAGRIIWGGAVLFYFLSGIIAREVGGIPLSMGYGGWKVRRTRNGRYRI